MEGLPLEFLDLGSDAIVGGITGDEALFDRSLEGTVEHEVDAADGGAAQAGGLILPNMDTAMLHEVFVEFLEVSLVSLILPIRGMV